MMTNMHESVRVIKFYTGIGDIPNQEGFLFRGWMKDGDLKPCIVLRNELGTHYAAHEITRAPMYDDLRGWTPYLPEPPK
jgi:hypothetical protein